MLRLVKKKQLVKLNTKKSIKKKFHSCAHALSLPYLYSKLHSYVRYKSSRKERERKLFQFTINVQSSVVIHQTELLTAATVCCVVVFLHSSIPFAVKTTAKTCFPSPPPPPLLLRFSASHAGLLLHLSHCCSFL